AVWRAAWRRATSCCCTMATRRGRPPASGFRWWYYQGCSRRCERLDCSRSRWPKRSRSAEKTSRSCARPAHAVSSRTTVQRARQSREGSMRVTLVPPAGFNFVPGQPDFAMLANRMAPVGIMQLASWLEKHGHPTQLHDALGPHAPPGIEANAAIVLATDPELVGFSATTSSFMDAVDMAVIIKWKRPHVKIRGGH